MQVDILRKLGFEPSGNGPWHVAVPSWRSDVVAKGRSRRGDRARLTATTTCRRCSMPKVSTMPKPGCATPAAPRAAGKRALAARGMEEAMSFSFMSSALAAKFGGAPDTLEAAQPDRLGPRRDAPLDPAQPSAGLRPHEARGVKDAALFEVGPTYQTRRRRGNASSPQRALRPHRAAAAGPAPSAPPTPSTPRPTHWRRCRDRRAGREPADQGDSAPPGTTPGRQRHADPGRTDRSRSSVRIIRRSWPSSTCGGPAAAFEVSSTRRRRQGRAARRRTMLRLSALQRWSATSPHRRCDGGAETLDPGARAPPTGR